MINFGLVRTMKTCPDCNGDGVVDKDTDNERQCSTCGGRGFVPDDDDDDDEEIKTFPICRARLPLRGS
jgi:DnaJ-class molecular chaperone